MFLTKQQQGKGDVEPASSRVSQEEATQKLREAKGYSHRARQKLGGLTQLAEEVGLLVPRLRRA